MQLDGRKKVFGEGFQSCKFGIRPLTGRQSITRNTANATATGKERITFTIFVTMFSRSLAVFMFSIEVRRIGSPVSKENIYTMNEMIIRQ